MRSREVGHPSGLGAGFNPLTRVGFVGVMSTGLTVRERVTGVMAVV